VKLAQLLEPYKPTWFEEPIMHKNISGIVEVARRIAIPVATGENLTTKQEFAELLSHNAIHILQPEIMNLGGFFTTRQVCAMVDAQYGVVAPHNAQGPVSGAMVTHLSASVPNFFIQEIFDDFNVGWEKDIVDYTVEINDGYIQIPERPGLGIDLNFEALAKYPYQQQNYLPLFKPGWHRRVGDR
jgi:galactonate dehydratase